MFTLVGGWFCIVAMGNTVRVHNTQNNDVKCIVAMGNAQFLMSSTDNIYHYSCTLLGTASIFVDVSKFMTFHTCTLVNKLM